MISKRFIILCLFVILSLIVSLLIFKPKQKILIGFVADFSAKSSDLGMQSRNGAQMAVDKINEKGGLWGHELELIVKDNKNDRDQTRAVVQELILNEVPVIIGPHLSRLADIFIDESSGEDVIVISPVVSTDQVIGFDDNFLRINTSASIDGRTLATAIIARGDRSIALLWSELNNEYTESVINGVRSELIKHDIDIVYENSITGKDSYSEIVQDLVEIKTDAVVFSAISMDTSAITQLYAKEAPTPNLYSCQWSKATSIISHGGKTVEGMILIGEYVNVPPDVKSLEFEEEYIGKFSIFPNFASIYAYESVQLFAEGVNQAGRNWDVESVKNSILNLKAFNGVAGTFELDNNGDAVREKSLFIIKNNTYVPYFP